MTAETPALIRTFRVGKRKVTLSVSQIRNGQVACAVIEWDPNMPRRLSRREWKQYRAGRDAAFAELFAEIGVRGAVLEV